MSFYRPSTGSSASMGLTSPNQNLNLNYFMSTPNPNLQQSTSTQQQIPFQQSISHISPQHQSPHSSSHHYLFDQQHHLQSRPQQRKSDGFEPMNTSPTPIPQQLHIQHQQPQYLPSFLTGDHMPIPHNLTAPEPSAVFESEFGKSVSSLTAQNKQSGPPVSGLGELSGVGNSAAAFEQSLAAAGNGNSNNSPGTTRPTTPISGTWVTIFGFPSSATTYVLTNFSQFGTIVEKISTPGSNWLHIKFSNKLEARKALNRNGTVLAGSMMIGVIPYDGEGSQTQGQGQAFTPLSTNTAQVTSPTTRENISRPGSSLSMSTTKENQIPTNIREVKNRIRPLAKTHTTSVAASPAVPTENSGIVARAVEYMFGW